MSGKSKKQYGGLNNKRLRKAIKNSNQTKQTTIIKPFDKIKKFFKSSYGIITIIGTIAAFVFLPKQIRENFMTQKEKFEEEKFIKGIFIPPSAIGINDTLIIEYGNSITYSYPVNELMMGADLKPTFVGCTSNGDNPFDVVARIRNNRIYISTTLKDIQNEEVVGIIDYEHWRLVKDKLLDYTETDESLEVIDSGGNVVFSMVYKYPNIISLKGYYIGSCYLVTNEGITSFSLSQKREALNEIKKIPRLKEVK